MLRKVQISKVGSGSTFLCKSRSDGTLLTASFNLRNRRQSIYKPRRDGTLQCVRYSCNRRLKSTVNKVPSLRDLLGWVA